MAKRGRKPRDAEDGLEQLDLMDVDHPQAKPIKAAARKYKKFLSARQSAQKDEVAAKQEIIKLVKNAKIAPDAEGVIKFGIDGITIRITPRDELVQIKLEDDDEGDGE